MKILYFSWLRECIGVSFEEYSTDQTTISGLIRELVNREPRYRKAFKNLTMVKVAIDQELVADMETSIVGAHEIAFFPPMTGG
ncbi:MAG: molybdopterin synthase sulfur carrier subunit [Rhodobacteraceae bacterium]|nr:MAG: molybdopterin synthase sulfur carrier subunit [Paracoccaceae bacterium]|tara:strand:+ start:233 stop:481 length:249 start_codon:yes stop_codon:yes gene_type:complete